MLRSFSARLATKRSNNIKGKPNSSKLTILSRKKNAFRNKRSQSQAIQKAAGKKKTSTKRSNSLKKDLRLKNRVWHVYSHRVKKCHVMRAWRWKIKKRKKWSRMGLSETSFILSTRSQTKMVSWCISLAYIPTLSLSMA